MEEPDNLYEKLVIALKDALYFVKQNELEKTDPTNSFQNKLLFKLFVLIRWQKLFC